MSSSIEKVEKDSEKTNADQKSVGSSELISEVELANYYEEKAGSLVVDPA